MDEPTEKLMAHIDVLLKDARSLYFHDFESQMVELPQVFLPFATTKGGGTLYEQVSKGNFLLGSGE